jgi:hypothetical protein
MGRASSAKKVQRVARASGRNTKSKNRRDLLFPAIVTLVVVLGVALVVGGKMAYDSDAASAAPELGDHWHAAVGVYVCDSFIDPLTDQNGDANGIHTHGDNVAHIHPSTSNATGENATIGVFAEETGVEFGDGSFTLPNGDTYANGDDCNGSPGKVRVVAWDSAADTSTGRNVFSEDLADVHFDEDGMAFTIAFIAEDEQVPPPPTAADLDSLGAIDAAPDASGQTVPVDPAATVPVDPAAGSSTTVAPGTEQQSSSTTAAG